MTKITIRTHYRVDDPTCSGDYCSVDVIHDIEGIIASYGDHYHDKGKIAAKAFVDGLLYGEWDEEFTIIRENVADVE